MKLLIKIWKFFAEFGKRRKQKKVQAMMNYMEWESHKRRIRQNMVKKGVAHFTQRKNKIKPLTAYQNKQLIDRKFGEDLAKVGLKLDADLNFKEASC